MKKNFFINSIISKFFKWSYGEKDRASRLFIVAMVFALGYGSVVCELIYISINTANSERKLTNDIYKIRNDIVDRNGHILATNIPVASLYANTTKMIDPQKTLEKLSTIIKDLDKSKLSDEFSKNKTFIWIKRDLTPKLQEQITALGLPGLYFESEQKRVYTQGAVASHLLGYVDRDNKGIAGLEKYFDEKLSKGSNQEPLQLSIDYRIQNIVSDELDKVIAKFSALGGVGVVADVKSGEVLAMVSKPDFDPHAPSTAKAEQLFNKASLGAYEIGSAIKAINFAIAFDTDTIRINDVYNIEDFTISKFRIKDYHKHNGWNTVPQLFMNSSNIGAGLIALEVGKKNYQEYMSRLGLNRQLSIELPERATPIFPPEKRWSDLGLITMSYGYGFSISPLHFVQGMIPVVNGGYKHPLTLLKKNSEATGEKVFAEETSMNMIKLLRLTVEKGTGRKASVKGYLVAGKTGTAEKLGPKGYLKNSRFSSFVATAPSIDPRFVVFIFLDDPQGIKETFGFATAGFTAAPVAGNIISKIGSLYGIQPFDEDDKDIKNMMYVDYQVDNET